MDNFLTTGRTALLNALKGDPDISAAVRNWFDYGRGLERRPELEPALCPFLCVTPEEGEVHRVANVRRRIPQVLSVDVATAGQSAAPAESLAALVIERVRRCNENCLGLADVGLAAVEVEGVRWEAVPGRSAAQLIWTVQIRIRLAWRR